MARTKTTSRISEDENAPMSHPNPPQQNISTSETPSTEPLHTILPDEIIPLSKPSKPK